MSVTADDYRYEEWPTRKPTKYAKQASKLATHPVEFVAEQALRKAHRSSRTVTKSLTGSLAAAGLTAANVGTLAGLLGGISAALVVGQAIAKNGRLKLGEKINAISNRFVIAQQEIERKLGVTSWAQVPEQVRAKWLADYKQALTMANSQAQGSAFAGTRAEGSYK